MKIIIIGNYLPDEQTSMKRFASMLSAGYSDAGVENEIWYPKVFFGKFVKNTSFGFGKWLGYIDKWIIFPFILKRRSKKRLTNSTDCFFHIGDHSNAPYLKYLPQERTVITCHDVLAIMGALGYPDTYCNTSRLGKVLQTWILKNLSAAQKLATVSQQTMVQLLDLANNRNVETKNWRVIHNGFNENFEPMIPSIRAPILTELGLDPKVPFILHVGSGQPRKNRQLLVEMASILKTRWKGNICFAGEGLDLQLANYASSLGVSDKIISIVNPEHIHLMALYSACDAFVFPSFTEGFGWPLIEAQACGAPVLASNVEPLPEITGGAAFHNDPYKANDFAEAFMSLQNKEIRSNLILRGTENIFRFDNKKMIQEYLILHGLISN